MKQQNKELCYALKTTNGYIYDISYSLDEFYVLYCEDLREALKFTKVDAESFVKILNRHKITSYVVNTKLFRLKRKSDGLYLYKNIEPFPNDMYMFSKMFTLDERVWNGIFTSSEISELFKLFAFTAFEAEVI